MEHNFPKGAIKSIDELRKLKVGTTIWRGIKVNVLKPWIEQIELKNKPSFKTIRGNIVIGCGFTQVYNKGLFFNMYLYLGDCNITSHHNMHYLFINKADAEEYIKG